MLAWPSTLVCMALFAATPVAQELGYQGRLLKADGTPETGVVAITFSVFAQPTGGAPLWSEVQNVGLSSGYYATVLGSVTPIPAGLFDGNARYLELSVGGSA